jgi:hypothetical protein
LAFWPALYDYGSDDAIDRLAAAAVRRKLLQIGPRQNSVT